MRNTTKPILPLIGVLLETPFCWRHPYFHWRSPYFHSRPNIFVGDPQILMGDPKTFDGNPQIFVGDPFILIGDPQILVGDPKILLQTLGISFETPISLLGTLNLVVFNKNMRVSNEIWGLQ